MEESKENKTAEAKDEQVCSEAKKSLAHKRLWAIAILLCLVAIVTGTYFTYSAYKAGDFLKAVAATTTSQALFTSDILNEYTSKDATPAAKSIVVDSSGDTCSFTFRIYNCLLDNKNVFNDKDVNAELSITAEGTTGEWSVKENDAEIKKSGQPISFPGYTATVKTFTVAFSKNDLDKAKFTIRALVVGDSPGTNLAMLAATVVPNRRADVTRASVTGSWLDKSGDNALSFDAYNYRVTVTGVKTRVLLSWGDDVELDSFFEENHQDASVDRIKRTAEFDMDPGSQIVAFFRKGSSVPASWDQMAVSVKAAKSTN